MDYTRTLETLRDLRSLYIGGGDDAVFTPAQKRWIQVTYKNETGTAIRECGCRNKYTDAVDTLLALLERRGALAEDINYKLRPGIIIWLDGDCYTRHNLTDEVARRWLALHPDGARLFESE